MQSIPLAVLKPSNSGKLYWSMWGNCMQSIPLAVLKQLGNSPLKRVCADCMQSIPLAVLKHDAIRNAVVLLNHCMQSIPLAVLKHHLMELDKNKRTPLHAIHTACGIETSEPKPSLSSLSAIACNPYRLRY